MRWARWDHGSVIKDLAEMSKGEYFACVRQRLGMYLPDRRLASLESFLFGYEQHAMRHGEPGLQGWTGRFGPVRCTTCSPLTCPRFPDVMPSEWSTRSVRTRRR